MAATRRWWRGPAARGARPLTCDVKETQPLGLEGGPRGQLIPVPLHGDAAPASPAPHTPAESAPAFAFRRAPSTRGARGRVSGLPANRVANRPRRPTSPRGRGRGELSPPGRHREPERHLHPAPRRMFTLVLIGRRGLKMLPWAIRICVHARAPWQLRQLGLRRLATPCCCGFQRSPSAASVTFHSWGSPRSPPPAPAIVSSRIKTSWERISVNNGSNTP